MTESVSEGQRNKAIWEIYLQLHSAQVAAAVL